MYSIIVFDDGNEKYQFLKNNWIIIDSMFNGDKLKLKNIHTNTIINSISSWKVCSLK